MLFQFLEPPFCSFIKIILWWGGIYGLWKTGMYDFPESVFTKHGCDTAGHSAQGQAHSGLSQPQLRAVTMTLTSTC